MGDYDYPREEQVTAQLPFLEFRFADSDNPYFAWEAYSLCREFGATVPDWAMDYLDRAARALLSGGDERRALGFKSKRGRDSKLREYRRVERDVRLALDVDRELRSMTKPKLVIACEIVAERYNKGRRGKEMISGKTAERAYKEVFG